MRATGLHFMQWFNSMSAHIKTTLMVCSFVFGLGIAWAGVTMKVEGVYEDLEDTQEVLELTNTKLDSALLDLLETKTKAALAAENKERIRIIEQGQHAAELERNTQGNDLGYIKARLDTVVRLLEGNVLKAPSPRLDIDPND